MTYSIRIELDGSGKDPAGGRRMSYEEYGVTPQEMLTMIQDGYATVRGGYICVDITIQED